MRPTLEVEDLTRQHDGDVTRYRLSCPHGTSQSEESTGLMRVLVPSKPTLVVDVLTASHRRRFGCDCVFPEAR